MKPLFPLLALCAAACGASGAAFYANDFAMRASGATPSGRWMEAAYVPGALARPVSSISAEGREPYNYATEYQDGWTMKTGYCRESVLFTVADDGDNQGALVNAKSRTTSYQSATIAMQPFYNEYTNVVLAVQTVASTGATAATATSGCAIDRSHWYRFRAKADQQADKFTVRVYDQGAAKPAAGDADGTLVATFEDLDLPAFDDDGMTAFGLAGAGFCGFSGGGGDDPNVAIVDNLSASGSVTFASFLEEYGLPPDTAPEAVTNDIPVLARYVFDIDPDIGPSDLAEPLIDVTFDADGAPGVKLPELQNTEGVTVTVLATEDLSDWCRPSSSRCATTRPTAPGGPPTASTAPPCSSCGASTSTTGTESRPRLRAGAKCGSIGRELRSHCLDAETSPDPRTRPAHRAGATEGTVASFQRCQCQLPVANAGDRFHWKLELATGNIRTLATFHHLPLKGTP